MRAPAFAASILAGMLATSASAEDQTVTLLSMNMWGAGANEGKSIDETVAVMKATGADIIAAVETVPEPDPCDAGSENCIAGDTSRAKELAAALGYYYHEFKHNTDVHWADAILSKYPFGDETPNGTGVAIDVNGHKVIAYAMNLNDAPYQPYQLLGIEYGPFPFFKTPEEAVKAASETRGTALALVLADVRAMQDAEAQFVMGDFNEPSYLDWTAEAVAAKLQPLAVEWPFTKTIADEGFIDTFRATYPDVAAKPGMTWTTGSAPSDPTDHHDRIDFILARGAALKVLSAGIVGEKAPEADLVVTPWPSDHRATMAKVSF